MYKSEDIDHISFTYKDKIQLKKKITNKLDKKEYLEIFKIIIENDIEYTENNNGIFFNLKPINSHVLKKISNYVDYCLDNRQKNIYRNNITHINSMDISNNVQNNLSSLTKIYEKYSIANKIIQNDSINDDILHFDESDIKNIQKEELNDNDNELEETYSEEEENLIDEDDEEDEEL